MLYRLEPRTMHIKAGDTIDTVMKNGTQAQKIAAPLFDIDGNGKYDENEAYAFEHTKIKDESNKLTIHSVDNNGKIYKTLEIIYRDLDQLHGKTPKGKNPNTISKDSFSFSAITQDSSQNPFIIDNHVSMVGDYKNVKIDLVNGKTQIDGAKRAKKIVGVGMDLNVVNSDVGSIDIWNCSLDMKNVKDERGFWNTDTDVTKNPKSDVNYDKDSNVKIKSN